MSSIINKTDIISVCGDTIFLNINNVLPTWTHYCFKLTVDTPGTKTIVFCVHQPQEPDSKPSSACGITMDTKLKQEVQEHDAIKFEEKDTMVADVEDRHIQCESQEQECGISG
ncbi:hypothetical protein P692DRAFT_20736115 [Suillus brevipes Sb2]|nr:hypothetical protein P692DRAFT_20736115 [Suillus brevipes Sb2]